MKIHLRLDAVTPEHITQTLFLDGKNCGKLVMDHGQYQLFGAVLALGVERTNGHARLTLDRIDHNADGEFTMPGNA